MFRRCLVLAIIALKCRVTLEQYFDISRGQSVPREKVYKEVPGIAQPGAEVVLPGGAWTNDAQDAFFDGSRLCARLRQPDASWRKQCTHVIADQTLKVVDGNFELDGAGEALFQEYTRISYPTDTVPGSWAESARNSRLSGSVLETELQKEDGTWVQTVTSVLFWHFLENIDGTLYIERAPCASLGVCVYSYVLKLDAKDIFCTKAVCDPLGDRDTCCDRVEPCTLITTCDRTQSLVPDLNGWCRDRYCDQILDQDICCVPAAFCDGLQCVTGYVQKPNAYDIQCPNSVCFPDGDRDLCCEQQGSCSLLPYTHEDCDVGEYFNSADLCAQRVCNNVTDLEKCCQRAMPCDIGLNCSHGFLAKPGNENIYCLAAECDIDVHLMVCCDAAAPCSDITCGHGYYQLSDTYCSGTSCNLTLDFDHCCPVSEGCASLADNSCPYGYWFDFDERCTRDPCEDSVDRLHVCCKQADPCTSLTCPNGYIYKSNIGALTCQFGECNVTTNDLFRCCDTAAHCDTLSCGHGFTPDPLAFDTYCPATTCDINRDRDLCCEPAPLCATAYACPHGFTAWPDTYCDGITCDVDRDRDRCCRPAMPCSALTCPLNYVLRYDTYCQGTTCIESRDLFWCCERGMALSYYRFLPLELRQSGSTVVQMSDFFLYNQQVLVDGYDSAVFYCDPCDTPVNLREEPYNLGDNNGETKWLDYSSNAFFVRLPVAQPAFSYSFVTGNDEPQRDPVRWQLWGSPNNIDWVILHEVKDRTTGLSIVPLDRKTTTGQIQVDVPCYSPTGSYIDNSANITCQEGDLIQHGSNCTPACLPGFTADVDQITCLDGELSPITFACDADAGNGTV